MAMRRTQVQLDEATYELLRQRAHERRVSMAKVVREAVAQYLAGGPKPRKKLSDFKFIGMGSAEPGLQRSVSEDHDAEWGAPEHDDRKPFETLIPGGAQTGLGWLTVPRKRDTYLWGPVGGRTKKNAWVSLDEIPGSSAELVDMSKDLARRGFKFVGPSIWYAFMRAAGMVNDHLVDCPRYREV